MPKTNGSRALAATNVSTARLSAEDVRTLAMDLLALANQMEGREEQTRRRADLVQAAQGNAQIAEVLSTPQAEKDVVTTVLAEARAALTVDVATE